MTRWGAVRFVRVSASAVRCRAPSRSPPSTREAGARPKPPPRRHGDVLPANARRPPVLGSVVAAWLIPTYGGQAYSSRGGVLPWSCCPCSPPGLPEKVQSGSWALRGDRATIDRCSPDGVSDEEAAGWRRARGRVRRTQAWRSSLFTDGRRWGTMHAVRGGVHDPADGLFLESNGSPTLDIRAGIGNCGDPRRRPR